MVPNYHCNAGAPTASGKQSETADTRPHASRVMAPTFRCVSYPSEAASMLWMRGQPHGELQRLYKVERVEGDPCNLSTRKCPKLRSQRPPRRSEGSEDRAFCRGDVPGRWLEKRRMRVHVVRPPSLQPQILIQNPLLKLSRWRPSSLMWPPPGRQTGLRSLKPNPQQPLSRFLGGTKRKQPRVSKSRPYDHNARTGGSHPKLKLPTQEISYFFDRLPSKDVRS